MVFWVSLCICTRYILYHLLLFPMEGQFAFYIDCTVLVTYSFFDCHCLNLGNHVQPILIGFWLALLLSKINDWLIDWCLQLYAMKWNCRSSYWLEIDAGSGWGGISLRVDNSHMRGARFCFCINASIAAHRQRPIADLPSNLCCPVCWRDLPGYLQLLKLSLRFENYTQIYFITLESTVFWLKRFIFT